MLEEKILDKQKIREKFREKIKERTVQKIIQENQEKIREHNLKAADKDEQTHAASLLYNTNEQEKSTDPMYRKTCEQSRAEEETFVVRVPLEMDSKTAPFSDTYIRIAQKCF